MEFSGEFELDGVSAEEAWIVLSDPIAVRNALRGCRFIAPMDEEFDFDEYEPAEDVETLPEADPDAVAERAFEEGETYAAVTQIGVGSVKPRFESTVTIDEREFPRMVATGGGAASDSSFEMQSGMEVADTDDGARVEWWAEADVTGRIAQLGNRVIDPVAEKVVNDFFTNVQDNMQAVGDADGSGGVTGRLRNLL